MQQQCRMQQQRARKNRARKHIMLQTAHDLNYASYDDYVSDDSPFRGTPISADLFRQPSSSEVSISSPFAAAAFFS